MNKPAGPVKCSPDAWMVLMSPVRSEVAEALRLLRQASVAEIAQSINRPADTLYRHIVALINAGLVRDAGFRKRGRTTEQIFELVAEDFYPDFSQVSRAVENQLIYGAASALLKAMDRTVRDAAAAGALATRPEVPNVLISYELGWLTPEMYREVRSITRRLKVIMDQAKQEREGVLYLTLLLASPVVRKRSSGGDGAEPPQQAPRPRRARATGKTKKV